MYSLVSRIQDGLGELKSLLETHIFNQGLAAIEKCGDSALNVSEYHKAPKFSNARKLCCNLPKIQTKSSNLRVFYQKDAN